MSNYFSFFPTIKHDLKKSGKVVELTNILRRFKVKDSVQDRTNIFYEYEIQNGDRPDVIAEKYYGNSKYSWIVLHYNDIIDPFYDWPLFDVDFDNYIKSKYGSISQAQSTVKNYYKILVQERFEIDGTRYPRKELAIDLETYNSLSPTIRRTETSYDYEVEENEKRKNIKILDKKYLALVLDEVETILSVE